MNALLRRLSRLLLTLLLPIAVLIAWALPANAACQPNGGYYSHTVEAGTSCVYSLAHGNIYGGAYGNIFRSNNPGYPNYCTADAVQITALKNGVLVNGNYAYTSSTTVAQSIVSPIASLVGSAVGLWSGGGVYYSEGWSPLEC